MPDGDAGGVIDPLAPVQPGDQIAGKIVHHRIVERDLSAFDQPHGHDGDDQLGGAGRAELAFRRQIAGGGNMLHPAGGVIDGHHRAMHMARAAHAHGLRVDQLCRQLRNCPGLCYAIPTCLHGFISP